MSVKVFFVGNPFGGDDGVGPALYSLLKDDSKLKDFELMEAGVIGFDMVSFIEDEDQVIIVDALKCVDENEVGEVKVLAESELEPEVSVVSEHDFGVEKTAQIMRMYKPRMKSLSIIGVKVKHLQGFSEQLTPRLQSILPRIKEDIRKSILELSR
ncbi:hydrogenase maturation protease [Candidatus Woesearchaeota archaeon]|nr:hydrogenase maturation protease [Candidatus Woesearchaeota archaeon]